MKFQLKMKIRFFFLSNFDFSDFFSEFKIFENFEGKNSSKRKGEKEDHTLIIWEAMQSLDNDLKKKLSLL